MKTRSLFIAVFVSLFLAACDKDKSPEKPPQPVIASFEVEDRIFEAGETISFSNTSQNATSFLWHFGTFATSTEEHPQYRPKIPAETLGVRFTTLLIAQGEDNSVDTTSAWVVVSKRIFRRIVITGMSESVRNLIPSEEGSNVKLLTLMGPDHAPWKWINEYQTIPHVNLPANFEMPFEYPVFHTWPNIAMDNSPWLIRVFAQADGNSTPVLLHTFYFVPSQQPATAITDKIYTFSLVDEDMSIEVEYSYISR